MSDSWDDYEPEEEEIEVTQGPRRRRRGNESRGSWYILTGLILGIGIGLVIAWVLSPVKYTDTAPASLAATYKDEYRRVIALAYASNHNLERARERLKLIVTDNPAQALASQAKRMLAEKQPAQEARALAVLAADLGHSPKSQTVTLQVVGAQTSTPSVENNLPTKESTQFATLGVDAAIYTPTHPIPTLAPTLTLTPTASFTPSPTPSFLPTATDDQLMNKTFIMKSKQEICGSNAKDGFLQIEVKDKDGNPLAGIPIHIVWKNGENVFYTGLVPEINPGYADFIMQPSVVYTLIVGQISKPVNNLSIPFCNGGLKYTFQMEN